MTNKTWMLWLLLAGVQAWIAAWAAVPVSYRPVERESWERIAARHEVGVDALRRANPGIAGTLGGWIRLPDGARLADGPVVALMASAQAEIAEIVLDARIEAVYRIVGREFHVGTWHGRRIVAGVTGGNMNNAAIGATLLFQHFDVAAMGFVGIAGGSGALRVGDVLVAEAAVQHDQGNWYDFRMPGGDTFAGLTWYPGGQPVLSDEGRASRLVLHPDPDILARIREGLQELELPMIGGEVAAFHGLDRYRPRLRFDGWSASGAQFVTSRHARQAMERRIARAAHDLGMPAPDAFVVDQEDFAAVLAAEQHGVPWFIVRTVVDLAAPREGGADLPLALYDDPAAIPDWLAATGRQSYARDFDWSYFYRQIGLVAGAIVAALAIPEHTEAAASAASGSAAHGR